MSDKQSKPPQLDYAPPEKTRSPARGAAAVLLGSCAGLFALPMLYIGITSIPVLIKDWKRFDGHDILGVAMFLTIGLVSAYIAIRWIRFAFRQ